MDRRQARRLQLSDGRVVQVRPLERRDRRDFEAAFAGLSPETRYLRFATPKPRLTKWELDFLVGIDHHSHEALLAVDPITRRGVAVVRYVEIPDEAGAAEIAATVVDEWQGRGLGGALVARLAERALEEGFSVLRASVLAANRRAIGMLLRAGFAARARRGLLREYELQLGARSQPDSQVAGAI